MLAVELHDVLCADGGQQACLFSVGVCGVALHALVRHIFGNVAECGVFVLHVADGLLTCRLQVLFLDRHLAQQRVDDGDSLHGLVGLGACDGDIGKGLLGMLGQTLHDGHAVARVGQRTEFADVLEQH